MLMPCYNHTVPKMTHIQPIYKKQRNVTLFEKSERERTKTRIGDGMRKKTKENSEAVADSEIR